MLKNIPRRFQRIVLRTIFVPSYSVSPSFAVTFVTNHSFYRYSSGGFDSLVISSDARSFLWRGELLIVCDKSLCQAFSGFSASWFLFDPWAPATRCIDNVFETSSLSITTVCDWTVTIREGRASRGWSLLYLAFAIPSAVLLPLAKGDLSTNTHYLGTNFGLKRSLLSWWCFHCAPLLCIRVISLICNAATFCWRFRSSYRGSVPT